MSNPLEMNNTSGKVRCGISQLEFSGNKVPDIDVGVSYINC